MVFHGSVSNDNNLRLKNSVLQKHFLRVAFTQFNVQAGYRPDQERMARATRRRRRARNQYLLMLVVVATVVMGILALLVM
ncbi:MAG: hypothetical protein R3330_06565 [Saprospiraceae bacterium]|nr:hypothetical protein [Saprospiraceae bacterium]